MVHSFIFYLTCPCRGTFSITYQYFSSGCKSLRFNLHIHLYYEHFPNQLSMGYKLIDHILMNLIVNTTSNLTQPAIILKYQNCGSFIYILLNLHMPWNFFNHISIIFHPGASLFFFITSISLISGIRQKSKGANPCMESLFNSKIGP